MESRHKLTTELTKIADSDWYTLTCFDNKTVGGLSEEHSWIRGSVVNSGCNLIWQVGKKENDANYLLLSSFVTQLQLDKN